MFDLSFSNAFERLADLLVARLGARRSPVFAADVVVVPSAAVERQLKLTVAERLGICANIRFPYLAQWLWSLVGRVDPGVPGRSPLDLASLTWRTYAALGDSAWIEGHPRLQAYLERSDPLMRFELAAELAEVFSHYSTYRSDWLEAWQRGDAMAFPTDAPDQGWQRALWQRLAQALALPPANPLRDFAQRLATDAKLPSASLPEVAHVFCLPDIPPLHLEVLRSLGSRIDLHLYALNPSEAFWFDVVDARQLARLKVSGRADHHETGHRLLAAWGQQARSHLGLLVDALDGATEGAAFVPRDACHLLGRLQDAILKMTDLPSGAVVCAPGDRSIEFHDCHSRTRELEVLHDRLLSLFREDATLTPGDVLVVTPDLEKTAPLVEAVFGAVPRDSAIPYTLTGLSRSRANPVARALLSVLALARSRWLAPEVQGLLEQPPVAARFGLDPDALERIRGWLASAGVRWGADADHRAALGLPRPGGHGFDDGLHRLFLGYAMPSSVAEPFLGRLPAGAPEGADAIALGALDRFTDALRALRVRIASPLPLLAWSDLLFATLAEFVAEDPRSPEDFAEVRAAVLRLATEAAPALGEQPLPADVVEAALVRLLDDPIRGGVRTGAVTFAPTGSLRSLPFRVVCMIGFDDGAFPAIARPREFDLMRLAPRLGDRQRQADDRNLFLDLVLAARDHLHVSFVGHGVRDDAPRPPSVLVAELIDYLVAALAPPAEAATARARLVVAHPLQPFAERAFRSPSADPRIRSHSRVFADALNARARSASAALLKSGGESIQETDEDRFDDPAAPFFRAPLDPPAPGQIPFDDLVRFFRNPSRFLLERRVGITLRQAETGLLDEEPFLVDHAARNALSARLMPVLLSGVDEVAVSRFALAGSEVPSGALGRIALAQELGRMRRFAERVRPWTAMPLEPPFATAVDVEVDGVRWTVTAAFPDLRAEGLVRWRDADAGAFDRIAAWLTQLVLWCSGLPPEKSRVTWICRDLTLGFASPTGGRPIDLLARLVHLFVEGQRRPSGFLPKSAWAYAANAWNPARAAAAWQVTEFHPHAEGADPSCRLALRGLPDPMGDGFEAFDICARTMFEPMLACLRESA